MPVQTIIIRAQLQDGTQVEHTKPLYRCEVCLCEARFGMTVMENNHRVRRWFCADHKDHHQQGA